MQNHTINLTERGIYVADAVKKYIEPRRYKVLPDSMNDDVNQIKESICQLLDITPCMFCAPIHLRTGIGGNVFAYIIIKPKLQNQISDKVFDFGDIQISKTGIDSLLAAGCFTLDDVNNMTYKQLSEMRGIGPRTLTCLKGNRLDYLIIKRDKLEKELEKINKKINNLMEGKQC